MMYNLLSQVDVVLLKQFLVDPNSQQYSYNISKSIVDASSEHVIVSGVLSAPFLLLTKGGLDTLELMLHSNKNIKFNG